MHTVSQYLASPYPARSDAPYCHQKYSHRSRALIVSSLVVCSWAAVIAAAEVATRFV